MAGRLYVVGSANMDLVVQAQHLPAPGETVIGSDVRQIPGGKGANQAVAAARLGASVAFVGSIGSDAFGVELRRALIVDGVDVTHLHVVDERPSGVALIVVDAAGENLIAVGSGANAAVSAGQVDPAFGSIAAADLVLLQLEIPLQAVERACRLARGAGAHVVLNAAPAPANPLDDLLPVVSTLIVNSGEASALSGISEPEAAAAELRRRGPQTVIVTLGGDGLLLADGQNVIRVTAEPVQVVDTTAAGDAFCGAFAAALLAGHSAEAAARYANAAAALATTRMGAQASLPTRAELDLAFPPSGLPRSTPPGRRESRT